MQLIQLLVRHLLFPDIGANHLLIPPDRRNEVAPCPEFVTQKIPQLSLKGIDRCKNPTGFHLAPGRCTNPSPKRTSAPSSSRLERHENRSSPVSASGRRRCRAPSWSTRRRDAGWVSAFLRVCSTSRLSGGDKHIGEFLWSVHHHVVTAVDANELPAPIIFEPCGELLER